MGQEVLGTTACDGCGGTANIKKRSNSQNYYLHCPTCGLDQRSGKALQNKWRAIAEGQEPEPEQAEGVADERGGDWKPSPQTQQVAERDHDEDDEPKGSGKGKWIIGLFLTGLSLVSVGLSMKGGASE